MAAKKKDIMLAITYHQKPNTKDTYKKGYQNNPQNTKFEESIVVSDNLKYNQIRSASVIINITKGVIENSRETIPNVAAFLNEYVQKYQNDIRNFIRKYRQDIVQQQVLAKLYEKSKNLKDYIEPVEVNFEPSEEFIEATKEIIDVESTEVISEE